MFDGNEIFQRLGHFAALYVQMAGVKEKVDPIVVVEGGLGLSYFVVVMRKLEILTARVQIDVRAEYGARHGRAFNVPTWSTFAPRRVPARLARFRLFPKRKVGRALFARAFGQFAFALGQSATVAERLRQQFCVVVIFFFVKFDRVEVNRTVRCITLTTKKDLEFY